MIPFPPIAPEIFTIQLGGLTLSLRWYALAYIVGIVLGGRSGRSRDNIMAQANNLRDVEVPTLLPGIKVNTSPTNHHPLQQLQLQRIEGPGWLRFGEVIQGANL